VTSRSSKVRTLEEAVAEVVRPGMLLHFALAQARPNAAIRELLRQFRGSTARFGASATGFGGPQLGLFLVACGLVDRIVTGFVGNQYPRVGPNARANRLIDAGSVDIDAWSLLTFLQRLKAGSMGLEWTVTGSLVGSDIAHGHNDVRRVEGATLVRALTPDVAFLHAVVADQDGNAILSVPVGEGIVGAAAARLGAIVTVERVVEREELRAAAGVPILPGAIVRAVCPEPFGAHPSGVFAPAQFMDYAYADDYDFIAESTDAHELDDDRLADWIETRLLPGPDAATTERLRSRNAFAAPVVIDADAPATPEETMAAIGSRLLVGLAAGSNPPAFVLTGIGVSSLAAWLARDTSTSFPPLISELGLYDYEPARGNPFLFNYPNLASVAGLADTETILGVLVQGHGSDSVGVLAAGQLDRRGDINSTRTSRGWITGSGGANDIASGSRRNVVLVPHRPGRLVYEVDFVTSPGCNVSAIVTDRAVMERRGEEFAITGVVVTNGQMVDAVVRDVVAATPWPVAVGEDVTCLEGPTATELRILREYDPAAFMLGARSSERDPDEVANQTEAKA